MSTEHIPLSSSNDENLPKNRLISQPQLYALTCFASLGVFLIACDQSVMFGVITSPQFQAYFHQYNGQQIGIMVGILQIAAFITIIASGHIADTIGRRKPLFAGACICVIGGAIQTFTPGFKIMVLGRIVSGFGVGLLTTIIPTYQCEVSPVKHRGKLACIAFIGNALGHISSVWIDYFSSYNSAWRLALFTQCVISGILATSALWLPESPRWLIDHDFLDEGRRVISNLHDVDLDDVKVAAEFDKIKEMVDEDRLAANKSYFAMCRRYRQRVIITLSSQAFVQLNGINVISYYTPVIFHRAGISRAAIVITSVASILGTISASCLVDVWGRRAILMSGAAVMAIALTATGWFSYIDQTYTLNAVVVCMVIFNVAFSFSWGPIPWFYPPEIMPLAFRAQGVSMSTATNWILSWVASQVTPTLQEMIKWRLYPMHSFFCCGSIIFVYFVYPETMGIPLEEMGIVFNDEQPSDDSETSPLVRRQPRTYDSPAGLSHSNPGPN